MALDEARGIVYVPTGSAAADFYGANRSATTSTRTPCSRSTPTPGSVIWHFQFVRHDIWDRDSPSPPNLITVRRDGKTIDAVAQATKHGYVFVFDRATGKPLFPIEYRKFPPSDVPGEVAADTQPFPTKPAPFARQALTAGDAHVADAGRAHVGARASWRSSATTACSCRSRVGRQTVIFPGFDGGAEWGGQAFDPETGLYYVNANDLAWTGGLAPNDRRPARHAASTSRIAPRATATIGRARRRRSRRSSASRSERT